MRGDTIYLPRLHPKFVELIEIFQLENKMNDAALAKYIKMDKSTLSHLKQPETGDKIKGRLTNTYIEIFIQKGVIKMDDIYDGAPESDLESQFWHRIETNTEGIRLMQEISDTMGIDMVKMMKAMLDTHLNKTAA